MAPSKKITKATSPAAEPPVAAEPVVAPEAVVAAEPVAAEAIATDAAVATPDASSTDVNDPQYILAQIQTRVANLQKFVLNETKEISLAIKSIQKVVLKALKKKAPKTAAATAAAGGSPRKPSGFAKPTVLSPAMSEFLGSDPETKLARTEVTRLITKYIKDNHLYSPKDKRTILPDPKLLKLLNINENTPLTYFKLQTHLKPHFLKVETPAAPVAVA